MYVVGMVTDMVRSWGVNNVLTKIHVYKCIFYNVFSCSAI